MQFVGHQLALRRCQPERIWKTAILDNRPNIIKCPVSTSCCARLKRCATLRNTSNLCNVLGSFGSVPGRQHKSYLDSCEKTFKWFGTHQLLSFVFLWARTSCIHCSNNHHLWTSCIYCSNKLSSIGTHHLEEVVAICRVKSYLRHLPMTPQNSNNVKEAGERNQLIALLLVALFCLDKSSVDWVVDALLWFPLSFRRCFLLWHRSV